MMLSNNKKISYKDIKKKLHLLVLISKFYLSLQFGYFWDTLYIYIHIDNTYARDVRKFLSIVYKKC